MRKITQGANVLIIGVAYKQDIADYRESPALEVIELLKKFGANVEYYDPWISEYKYQGIVHKGMTKISPKQIENMIY